MEFWLLAAYVFKHLCLIVLLIVCSSQIWLIHWEGIIVQNKTKIYSCHDPAANKRKLYYNVSSYLTFKEK
jgi:hypothetical protein